MGSSSKARTLLCAATLAGASLAGCEDSRPPSAPGSGHAERDALVQQWNALEARLEEDNTSRVRKALGPTRSVELDAASTRASSALHEARRILETLTMNFPEQARSAQLARAHEALDTAETAVAKADALRESLEPAEAGAPPSASAAPVVLGPPAPSASAAP